MYENLDIDIFSQYNIVWQSKCFSLVCYRNVRHWFKYNFSECILACLNIPGISPKSLKARERGVGRKIEDIAKKSCEEYAAKEIVMSMWCNEYVFCAFFFKSNYKFIPILSQTCEFTRKKIKIYFLNVILAKLYIL